MKPTKREYEWAKAKGQEARRAGRPESENLHRNDHSERGQILAEAWHDGWSLKDRSSL